MYRFTCSRSAKIETTTPISILNTVKYGLQHYVMAGIMAWWTVKADDKAKSYTIDGLIPDHYRCVPLYDMILPCSYCWFAHKMETQRGKCSRSTILSICKINKRTHNYGGTFSNHRCPKRKMNESPPTFTAEGIKYLSMKECWMGAISS